MRSKPKLLPYEGPEAFLESLHRCGECRHSRLGTDAEPVHSWRSCAAGHHGGWPLVERWRTAWQAN